MMTSTARGEPRGPRSSGPRLHDIAHDMCLPRAVRKRVMLGNAEPSIMPFGYDRHDNVRRIEKRLPLAEILT